MRAVRGKRSLAVRYALSGTAVNGQDYKELSGVVWINPGELSATVTIQPIAGGNTSSKNVVLTLSHDPFYTISGSAGSGNVTILS
jgi:hypothetical protein